MTLYEEIQALDLEFQRDVARHENWDCSWHPLPRGGKVGRDFADQIMNCCEARHNQNEINVEICGMEFAQGTAIRVLDPEYFHDLCDEYAESELEALEEVYREERAALEAQLKEEEENV